jgi:YVTN family beta-propeller protein
MGRNPQSTAVGAVLLAVLATALPRANAAAPQRELRIPNAGSQNYQGPLALAAARDGRTLYVACADAGQVAWVGLPKGHILRRVPMPAAPSGLTLSPDGRRLFVTCAAPQSTMVALDALTGKSLAEIRVGHTAMSPVVSPDGRRLFVCNRFHNDVSVIDLAGGREIARVAAVREPVAAAITPAGDALLVANHLPLTRNDGAFKGDVSPVVTRIDTRTLKTTAIPLSHGASSVRGICVTVDGRYACVAHLLSNFESIPFRVDMGWINVNVVSIIDLHRQCVTRTLGMDEYDAGAANPWDLTFTSDGKWICASLSGTHELCVIETAALLSDAARSMSPVMGAWPIYTSLGYSMWRRVALPGKGPRGLVAVGEKVYAAQYFSDTLAAVDVARADAPVGSIALGPVPQLTLERRGELLFNDATICYQHWQSCASCHPDARADALTWDLINDGTGTTKNTKSMLLAHRTPPSMSEGVRSSAEEAVRSGIHHILFNDRVEEEEPAAIDAYLKALRPVPSPHLVNGRLSAAAERGQRLFHSQRVGCDRCHPAPLYTDLRSHNVGSRGYFERATRFDTPTLIEVWRTAPYLHDGRWTTVKELLVEGRHGLRRDPAGALSPAEIDDLVEFVLSL